MTDDQLREEIKKIAAEYDVSLTDSQIDSLVSLCRSMEKLDTAALKGKGPGTASRGAVTEFVKDRFLKVAEGDEFESNTYRF